MPDSYKTLATAVLKTLETIEKGEWPAHLSLAALCSLHCPDQATQYLCVRLVSYALPSGRSFKEVNDWCQLELAKKG